MTTALKPLPYQKHGIAAIEATRDRNGGNMRALLADEMGLGKTPQALWWLKRNVTEPAVVVCPAGVKLGWQRMAASFTGRSAVVLEGKRPWHEGLLRPPLVVVNYDIASDWLDWLRALRPGALVIDECQNIMNMRAQRTKAVRALAKEVPHILCMSGTPFMNRPFELFSTLNILWPDEFPSDFAYGMRYCQPRRAYGAWKFDGAANIPELRERLLTLGMVRRLKRDVQAELPPIRRSILPVALDDKDRKEYDDALLNFVSWLRKRFDKDRAVSAAKAERLVQMGYLKRLAARLKMKHVVAWLDQFLANTDQKIVVMAWHTGCIEAIHRRYHGRCVTITGSMSAAEKQRAVDQFRRDPHCRMMAGNLQAAGTGIDGMQVASTVAIIEFDFRPAIHEQAEGRIDRIGRGQHLFAYYFVAADTIEERLCKLIQAKARVFGQVFDGAAVPKDFDLFDLLQKQLEEDYRAKRDARRGIRKLLPAQHSDHVKT